MCDSRGCGGSEPMGCCSIDSEMSRAVSDAAQKKAWLLVQPICNEDEITINGFPTSSLGSQGSTYTKLYSLSSGTTIHQNPSWMSSLANRTGHVLGATDNAWMSRGRTHPNSSIDFNGAEVWLV